MNKECIEKILEAAVRAPSGDNVQPWDIKVSENFAQIDVYNLPEKDESLYNDQQIASFIAHGALLENILIAAKHLGCHARYQLFPEPDNAQHVVTIQLSKATPEPDPYYDAIFRRQTNRFPYRKVKISEQTLQALQQTVAKIDGAKVSLVTEQDTIEQLADILKVNDRIVFENKKIHQFLFDKIRWNKQQIEQTQDGMPVDALGLSFMEKLFFPLLRFWGYVSVANVFGLSKIIELKCWWQCRQASLLGMLAIKGTDKAAFVEGGRAVQRLWLEVTVQGLSMQPIIGLTLLIGQLRQDRLNALSEKHQLFIQQANEKLPELFGLDTEDTLVMGFRLGGEVGAEKRVKTLRKIASQQT